MTGKRITLKDIAEEAGVSKTIASKVVNGISAGKVSAGKRKIIQDLIQKYHYAPLYSARSLVTKRNHQIAFLLSDTTSLLFENPVFAQQLQGVLDSCRKHEYSCQVDYYNFLNIKNFVMPKNLLQRSVDGCILAGSFSEVMLDNLSEVQIPAVVLGGESIRSRIPAITRTSRKEYETILRYCYERGHRRIMITDSGRNSMKVYPELLRKFPGMQLELRSEDTFADCETIAGEILGRKKSLRPTLLFGNEIICTGILNLLRSAGLECPRDISCIISTRCLRKYAFIPPLTTFSVDFVSSGMLGADLLIEMIEQDLTLEDAVKKAKKLDIHSVFIEQDSVRDLQS